MTSWRQRWQGLSPVGCGLGLFAALAAAWLISLPLAWHFSGSDGIAASALAALACWCGTLAALLVTQTLRRRLQPAYAVLAGMGARMVLPMVVAISLQNSGGALAQAGIVYYLIVFYQVALVLETSWFVARLETT